MSFENASWGAGGGIISGAFIAILTAMGLKDRINRLEREKLNKETMLEFQKGLDLRLANIESLLNKLLDRGGIC